MFHSVGKHIVMLSTADVTRCAPDDGTLDVSLFLQHTLLEASGWVKLDEVFAKLDVFPAKEVMATIEAAASRDMFEVKSDANGAKIVRAIGAQSKPRIVEIEVLAADALVRREEMPHAVSTLLVAVPDLVAAPTQVSTLSLPAPAFVADADPLASTSPPTSPQSPDLEKPFHLQNVENDCGSLSLHAKTRTASECVSVDGVPTVDDHTPTTMEGASHTSSELRSTAGGHGTFSPSTSVSSVESTAGRTLMSESRDELAVVDVVSQEKETKFVSAVECGTLKCANPRCRYLVHSSSDLSWPFCCGRCWCRHTGVMRGRAAHGDFCERREAGPGAVAAQYTLTEDDLATVAEAEEWRRVERLKALSRASAWDSADAVLQKSLPQPAAESCSPPPPTPQLQAKQAEATGLWGQPDRGAGAILIPGPPPLPPRSASHGVPAPPPKRPSPQLPAFGSCPPPPSMLPAAPVFGVAAQTPCTRGDLKEFVPPPPAALWDAQSWETEAPPSVAEIPRSWAELGKCEKHVPSMSPRVPKEHWQNVARPQQGEFSHNIVGLSSAVPAPPPPFESRWGFQGDVGTRPLHAAPPGLATNAGAQPPSSQQSGEAQIGTDAASRCVSSPWKATSAPPLWTVPPPPPKGKPTMPGGPQQRYNDAIPVTKTTSIRCVDAQRKEDVKMAATMKGDSYTSCRISGETSASTPSTETPLFGQDRYYSGCGIASGVNKIPRRQTCASAQWLGSQF